VRARPILTRSPTCARGTTPPRSRPCPPDRDHTVYRPPPQPAWSPCLRRSEAVLSESQPWQGAVVTDPDSLARQRATAASG
jgi:hypothetical protein